MTDLSASQLQRNVRLQVLLRIFQKRVFLPLAAIYFTTVAGFSLADIGLLATWFAVIQVVFEVPTGMFADRYGKVLSERLGAFLNICATLLYVFAPHKQGIFLGAALEAVGYSFFGGACEALLHDTLQAQGRERAYTKVLSRIQSMSLLINALLIAVVTLTYSYDPTYPFLLGTLAYTVLFITTFFLREVYPRLTNLSIKSRAALLPDLTVVRQYRHLFLFLGCFGIISALYTAPSDFTNIAIRDLGVAPEKMGLLFAAASLAGVVMGWFIHLFKRFPFRVYAIADWAVLFVLLTSFWINKLPLIIVVYIITMAFWRYRRIIYQEKLLQVLNTNKKATALSVMNNAGQLNELYLPALFGFSAARIGIPHTFGVASVCMVGLLFVWLVSLRTIPARDVAADAIPIGG